MKLLVTGGAGFIGSNFIRYWLNKYPKDQIVNLDKLTYAGSLESTADFQHNLNYKFIYGDICDADLVDKIMDDVDVIVHFAAESHVDRSIEDPQIFLRTNVIGTHVLLDAALKHKIKRFHHMSLLRLRLVLSREIATSLFSCSDRRLLLITIRKNRCVFRI